MTARPNSDEQKDGEAILIHSVLPKPANAKIPSTERKSKEFLLARVNSYTVNKTLLRPQYVHSIITMICT